jgi:hypothetical protein
MMLLHEAPATTITNMPAIKLIHHQLGAEALENINLPHPLIPVSLGIFV